MTAPRPRCPRGGRHWFTVYGWVGLRRPTCARCGAPNPYWTAAEREEWEWFAKTHPARAELILR